MTHQKCGLLDGTLHCKRSIFARPAFLTTQRNEGRKVQWVKPLRSSFLRVFDDNLQCSQVLLGLGRDALQTIKVCAPCATLLTPQCDSAAPSCSVLTNSRFRFGCRSAAPRLPGTASYSDRSSPTRKTRRISSVLKPIAIGRRTFGNTATS